MVLARALSGWTSSLALDQNSPFSTALTVESARVLHVAMHMTWEWCVKVCLSVCLSVICLSVICLSISQSVNLYVCTCSRHLEQTLLLKIFSEILSTLLHT